MKSDELINKYLEYQSWHPHRRREIVNLIVLIQILKRQKVKKSKRVQRDATKPIGIGRSPAAPTFDSEPMLLQGIGVSPPIILVLAARTFYCLEDEVPAVCHINAFHAMENMIEAAVAGGYNREEKLRKILVQTTNPRVLAIMAHAACSKIAPELLSDWMSHVKDEITAGVPIFFTFCARNLQRQV